MKTICIFNPEHDLCLAGGSKNFMPPRSAMDFARKSASVMNELYPEAQCVSIEDFIAPDEPYRIIPWGWNEVLKAQLLKKGVPEAQLPTDEKIKQIKALQHRSTALPLQKDVRECKTIEDIESGLQQYGRIVLKATLSGSGRGLRWINDSFVENDIYWITKQLQRHRSVMLEPRRNVVLDFALEYTSVSSRMSFVGYSLFDTQNGVYRGNKILTDEKIAESIKAYIGIGLEEKRVEVEAYLSTLADRYEGPVGVDMMVCSGTSGYEIAVSEINFRHTMGLIAHEAIRNNNYPEDQLWTP